MRDLPLGPSEALAFPLSFGGPVKNETRPVSVIMSVYRTDFILSPSNWSELNVVPVPQNVSFPMKPSQIKK